MGRAKMESMNPRARAALEAPGSGPRRRPVARARMPVPHLPWLRARRPGRAGRVGGGGLGLGGAARVGGVLGDGGGDARHGRVDEGTVVSCVLYKKTFGERREYAVLLCPQQVRSGHHWPDRCIHSTRVCQGQKLFLAL